MIRKTIRPNRAKISTKKFHLIVSCFCDDLTAFETGKIVKVNRHTVENYFNRFRNFIFRESQKDKKLEGEIEIDESYFGPTRVRGKRGRGAGDKIPVVGLLKRNGKVYTKIILDCTKEELLPIIKGKVITGSTIYTDGWTSYDSLIFYGYKHRRIHLHHRLSYDIDLFTEKEEVNQRAIDAFLKKISPNLGVAEIKRSQFLGLFSYILVFADQTELKVDFNYYP